MSSASYGLAQGLQRATVTRGLAAGSERFEGRSRYNRLSPTGRPSGVSVAGEGPAAVILKGPVQLSESFSLRTLLSVSFRIPWGMVAAVLYTQTHPPAAYWGGRRRASDRAELRPLTRATVKACCSRTTSYARCWRSRARSQ